MPRKPDFETMFNPKSVAFIGASAGPGPGGGSRFLSRYIELGFPGRLYPVNPKATEIMGLKAYPSIGSIPETVDFAIVALPRQLVPQILTECADADVKNIHIFTAGFRETGEKEGIELEKKIKEIADERGLAIIGPNSLGPYVPKSGMGPWSGVSKDSGPVALLSQSGTIAGDCTTMCWEYGVRFSKAISFGNGTVLDSTDYLEYLADDPETGIIAMYLEGIGDGRKLTKLVKEISPRKPVIIMKGGLTESGARAVASHTGSLAGSEAIWNAFFKQTGAIRVRNQEEIMDMCMTFTCMPPLRGKRLALMGTGGGLSVAGADACAQEGLELPPLAEETVRTLQEYVPSAGSSVQNPLDTAIVFSRTDLLEKSLNTIASDPAIDAILICLILDPLNLLGFQDSKRIEENYRCMSDFARNNPFRKPLAVVFHPRGYGAEVEAERLRQQAVLIDSKVAVFPSFRRAALAMRRFADYHDFVARRD